MNIQQKNELTSVQFQITGSNKANNVNNNFAFLSPVHHFNKKMLEQLV